MQLGLQPGKQIGSKELDTFWTKFAKGKNKLSKKEMRKFLMQLAKELQVRRSVARCLDHRSIDSLARDGG